MWYIYRSNIRKSIALKVLLSITVHRTAMFINQTDNAILYIVFLLLVESIILVNSNDCTVFIYFN